VREPACLPGFTKYCFIWHAAGSSLGLGTGWRLLVNFCGLPQASAGMLLQLCHAHFLTNRFNSFLMTILQRYKLGPVTVNFEIAAKQAGCKK
jgi:hypothetical protein